MNRSNLVMLDLFAGLKGASQAMVDRGWTVYTVEILERFHPTIVGDVAHLPLLPFAVDLLWASPPCTEYTRKDLPWFRNQPEPDLRLYEATRAIITEWRPRFYVIENVRGAQRYWGRTIHYKSRYLWTDIPLLPEIIGLGNRDKRSIWGGDPLAHWKRSKIPYAISDAIAATIEAFS